MMLTAMVFMLGGVAGLVLSATVFALGGEAARKQAPLGQGGEVPPVYERLVCRQLVVVDTAGCARVVAGLADAPEGAATLALYDSRGKQVAQLLADGNGVSGMTFYGVDGARCTLGVTESQASLEMLDAGGHQVLLGAGDAGATFTAWSNDGHGNREMAFAAGVDEHGAPMLEQRERGHGYKLPLLEAV